ncbi:hypothetical protein HDU76_014011 [Blyttiomyces sp. JEL0837]|nr:hypothetical protein HDU76_014011 [Blyttiomyces sp. JEL0837]
MNQDICDVIFSTLINMFLLFEKLMMGMYMGKIETCEKRVPLPWEEVEAEIAKAEEDKEERDRRRAEELGILRGRVGDGNGRDGENGKIDLITGGWFGARRKNNGKGGGTLVNRHGWSLPEVAGDPVAEAFAGFGDLVKDRIRECLMDPRRFQAHLSIHQPDHSISLTFQETVSTYRRITLLTLDFQPSPWSQIITDIRLDHERTQLHYSLLKSALVQSLEIVGRKHPAILVSGGVPDPLRPEVCRPWREMMDDLVKVVGTGGGNKGDNEGERNGGGGGKGKVLTEEQKLVRKKMFLLLTVPEGEEGPKKSTPYSYIITLTSPDDIFFNFTSAEITPETFLDMTRHMDLLPDGINNTYSNNNSDTLEDEIPLNNSPISKSLNQNEEYIDDVSGFQSIDRRRRRLRLGLGFRPNEGRAGGVVGVLGEDLIKGCEEEPERFSAVFKLGGVSDDVGDERLNTMNPPLLRRGRLVFMERVVYRTRELIDVEFFEISRDQMKVEVQERYAKLKKQIDWTQHRLDTLHDAVRRKNPALMVDLGAIPIPRSYTSTTHRWTHQYKDSLAAPKSDTNNDPSSSSTTATTDAKEANSTRHIPPTGIIVPVLEPETEGFGNNNKKNSGRRSPVNPRIHVSATTDRKHQQTANIHVTNDVTPSRDFQAMLETLRTTEFRGVDRLKEQGKVHHHNGDGDGERGRDGNGGKYRFSLDADGLDDPMSRGRLSVSPSRIPVLVDGEGRYDDRYARMSGNGGGGGRGSPDRRSSGGGGKLRQIMSPVGRLGGSSENGGSEVGGLRVERPSSRVSGPSVVSDRVGKSRPLSRASGSGRMSPQRQQQHHHHHPSGRTSPLKSRNLATGAQAQNPIRSSAGSITKKVTSPLKSVTKQYSVNKAPSVASSSSRGGSSTLRQPTMTPSPTKTFFTYDGNGKKVGGSFMSSSGVRPWPLLPDDPRLRLSQSVMLNHFEHVEMKKEGGSEHVRTMIVPDQLEYWRK